MTLANILRNIDAQTARAFVTAARHVIDAMLIEAERIEHARTPRTRDYNQAELPRAAPGGGWITDTEIRDTSRRLSEAISTERWQEGVGFALRILQLMGGA